MTETELIIINITSIVLATAITILIATYISIWLIIKIKKLLKKNK